MESGTFLSPRVVAMMEVCRRAASGAERLGISAESVPPDLQGVLGNGAHVLDDFCSAIPHKPSSYFLSLIQKYAPDIASVYESCRNEICLLPADRRLDFLIATYGADLFWTGQSLILLESLSISVKDLTAPEDLLWALQCVTCATERALGSILVGAGHPCPSILKEILSSPVLESILEQQTVEILSMLMGPPTSLNLRNLAWHGFLHPSEVLPELVVYTVIVLRRIGNHLEEKGAVVENRKSLRVPLVRFPFLPDNSLSGGDSKMNEVFIDGIGRCLEVSSILPRRSLGLWKYILELFNQKRIWKGVMLLLPQLETFLRLVFAIVNHEAQRVLTAEIFSKTVNDKGNKMRDFLGDGLLTLLLDLFIYPEGPRLRHRISHGEVDETTFDPSIVPALLAAALGIMWCACRCQSEHQPSLSASELFRGIQSYQAQFHPVSLLTLKFDNLRESLLALSSVSVIPDFIGELSLSESFQEAFLKVKSHFREGPRSGLEFILVKYANCGWAKALAACSREHRFETVYRPAYELSIIKLLSGILHNVADIMRSFNENLNAHHAKWLAEGDIQNRAALLYSKLLKIFPRQLEFTFAVYLLSLRIFITVQLRQPVTSQDSIQKISKLLRKILQICENISSLSKPNVNQWIKVDSWLDKFDSLEKSWRVLV